MTPIYNRDPGTDICLNCPLPEYTLTGRGFCETCSQSNDWHGNRKSEPVCLLAQAKYYGVDLEEAEQIAKVVGLTPGRRITAYWYTEALKERTANNNGNGRKEVRETIQHRGR
jgi:hypothetical protein